MPTLTVTHEAPLELIRQHPSLALELDSVITLHDPATGEPALVVICPDPAEGEKCRQGVATGHPGFDLLPIVIDPLHVPSAEGGGPWLLNLRCVPGRIGDGNRAGRQPYPERRPRFGSSEADRKRLITLILKGAPAAARQILEDLMATTEWKSDFVESFVNVGIEKGLEQGREQGIVEGAIRAKAEDILKVLDARLLKPTKEQRGQVNAATDLAQLDRWFDRALTAATAAEIFAD